MSFKKHTFRERYEVFILAYYEFFTPNLTVDYAHGEIVVRK